MCQRRKILLCSASADPEIAADCREISVREQIRDAVQHREMHAEERTVRYVQQVQRENQCVQREQLRQVRVRRELTGQRDRYAQKDRLRQQDVPAEREDRYVRREMTDHSVQAVTERTVRFVTAVMQEADVRMETEESASGKRTA